MLFKLSQVSSTIGFSLDPLANAYVYAVAVRGFINGNIYQVNCNTSLFTGQVLISTDSVTNFSEAHSTLVHISIDAIGNSSVF